MMPWVPIKKADWRALRLADRHYTRQKPGTSQFTRPGRNLVLLTEEENALWVTWHGIRDDGWNAWECTMFRNEGYYLSSHLIVLALGITRYQWGEPPRTELLPTSVNICVVDAFMQPVSEKPVEAKAENFFCSLLRNDFRPH